MTEAQFQAARKVMQQANAARGQITYCKTWVAHFTRKELLHRQYLRPEAADDAKKKLDKAIEDLAKARKRFADMKFPEDEGQGIKWIAAVEVDSFNYFPKAINAVDFDRAEDEGLELFTTQDDAQKECDRLNGQ